MSSGKQVSFAFGEVSPEMNYRTDTALYPQALKKLFNGYVRKAGGSSNRPGTRFLGPAGYQERLTETGAKVGVRIFPFYLDNTYYLVELQDRYNGSDSVLRVYNLNGTNADAYFDVSVTFDPRFAGEQYDLARASFSQLNNSMTITVPRSGFDGINIVNDFKTFIISESFSAFSYTTVFPKPTYIGTPSGAAVAIICYGEANLMQGAVTYIVTQEQDDGTEVKWLELPFTQCNPNSQCQSKLSTLHVPKLDGVKQYNVYRSAGEGGSHSFLVGRITPKTAPFVFQDYIENPDVTVQPPIDDYLYPIEDDGFGTMVSQHIKHLFYYKSRAVIIYHPHKPSGSNNFKYVPGQFGLSKIGSPRMFGRPLTPNIIDAFSATIPTDKVADITNYLVLNRLILFTKDVTVMIRGGDNGILTPQTVNPEIIYHEGCAEDIKPVASGTRGFFVPPNKSKLLMIKYGTDETLTIVDISVFSAHLFETREIRSMAMVPGADNILWILKTDGTLISLSISEEGTVQAFSRHNLDGFIEDITSLEMFTDNFAETFNDYFERRTYTLILSVVRDGVRGYESLAIRDDVKNENFLYADAVSYFGSPFTNKTMALNITPAVGSYLAGAPLTLEDTLAAGSLSTLFPINTVIDFSYPGESEEQGTLKFRVVVTGIDSANQLEVTAEEDVPAYLQDVDSQSLTAFQKLARKQTFLKARNRVTGLQRFAGKQVTVYTENQVISSPLNPDIGGLEVDEFGVLELPDYYTWGYVGLPFYFEMESLDLDASDARTFTDKGKLINSSGIAVHKTMGGLIGTRENNQEPVFQKIVERETYGNTSKTELVTGVRNIPFPGSWNMKGSIVIRQVDPLPITVLSIYPKGLIGD